MAGNAMNVSKGLADMLPFGLSLPSFDTCIDFMSSINTFRGFLDLQPYEQ